MGEIITIGDREYEKLDIKDLHGFITYDLYVLMANGEVKEAEFFPALDTVSIKVRGERGFEGARTEVNKIDLEIFCIQLLKLLPRRAPIEFTAIVFESRSNDDYIMCAPKEAHGKRFLCTEIIDA